MDNGRAECLAFVGTTKPRVVQHQIGQGLSGDNFGFSVAGPLTIAGKTMVLVGSPYNDKAGMDAGMFTLLVPGNPWVPKLTMTGDSPGDLLGYQACTCGDIDLDGTPDFAVSAIRDEPIRGTKHSGAVWLCAYSSSTKKLRLIDKRYHEGKLGCDNRGMQLGVRLAKAGDVDQDDFADPLIGTDWFFLSSCQAIHRAQRQVYLDTTRRQTLYADRAHALMSKGSASVNFRLQMGKAHAGEPVILLQTGPHNAARPAKCRLSIGSYSVLLHEEPLRRSTFLSAL
ncbi:MAG: hypothetical protein CSA62_09075 [Planctomycetota bacterium]|nr:MAG: hypothetical protein CSA62_09075 [Planctomycetota bacterium]